MKTKSILSVLPLCLCLALFTIPTNSEAQILKRLSKGLEKVNQGLEKVNKGLDNLNLPKLKKEEKKVEEKVVEKAAVTDNKTAETTKTEPKTIDTKDWKTVEPKYLTPYISGNTKFLKIDESYITDSWFSSVYEGVFCFKKNHKYEFWQVTGERLYAAEWEYPDLSYGKHPYFNSGVCPMVSSKPDANGKKRWHLLYLDGSVKELDPTYKEISFFQDGLAILTQTVNYKNEYYYINVRGEKVFTHLNIYGDHDEALRPLRCGMRAFLDRETHKWGYIDANGKVVLPAKYLYAKDFSEGYAWVSCSENDLASEGQLLLIDKTGKVVFNTELKAGKYGYSIYCSDVVNGRFYVKKGAYDNVTYYDITGRKLGTFSDGKPFCNNYAFVNKDEGGIVGSIKVINSEGAIVRSFTFDRMHSIDKTNFSPLGTAVYSDMDDEYFHDAKGDILISAYDGEYYDGISGFENFTADGYALVKNIEFNNKKYVGLMNTKAEMEWLFSNTDYADNWDDWPRDPIDTIDTIGIRDPVPQPRDPEDGPIGPKVRQKQEYKVTVKCEPAKGGTASISPAKTFLYGDMTTLTAKANKNWGISGVTSNAKGYDVPNLNEPFAVTTDMELTVHFLEEDTVDVPQHTNAFQGTKRKFIENKEWSKDTEIYAEISQEPNISTPYGDNTYGFITAMIDPSEQLIMPDFTAYLFTAPMKICGYQHDKTTDRHWMVIEGGAYAVGNLQVHPEGAGGLAAFYFTAILAFNGYSDFSIIPRRYRLEMLDYNQETGEFTCGMMQTFSGTYGWLDADDDRLKVKEQGFFMTAVDKGLPGDLFNGATLKVAKKRNDVHWYPSVKWYKDDENAMKVGIESLGNAYRSLETEYDKLFEE